MLYDRQYSKTKDTAGHTVKECKKKHKEAVGIELTRGKQKGQHKEHIDYSQMDTGSDKLDPHAVSADNQGSGDT